jgi:hypothetical protein
MFIITREQNGAIAWLISESPERWSADRDRAMRFGSRWEARRAAITLGIRGDWSIQAAGNAPPAL